MKVVASASTFGEILLSKVVAQFMIEEEVAGGLAQGQLLKRKRLLTPDRSKFSASLLSVRL